jgi:hypothetical protein
MIEVRTVPGDRCGIGTRFDASTESTPLSFHRSDTRTRSARHEKANRKAASPARTGT